MSDWQDALFARRTLGVQLTLEAVRRAYAALGSPGAALPAVHVVGTNGKGSTAAMVAHALQRRGRRVGLYTSPHLHRVGERIRVDGQAADDAALQRSIDRVLAAEGGLPRPLTFFEILTLAALLEFAAAGVDVLVLEAGLGGRLDATRVATMAVTLVTPIDLDHQSWLGDTIAAIAAEKAAVFECGAPAFSAPQAPAAAEVLRATAAKFATPLTFVTPLARAPVGLPGEHQRVNAALALAGARRIDPGVTADDLDGVRWPARCERVALGAGTVVFDASHNPHGIAALVAWLSGQAPRADRAVVFGCLADKDAPEMLRRLTALGCPLWLVPPGPGAYELAPLAAALPDAQAFAGPDDPALRAALDAALARGGEVVVCGSHALVGKLRGEALGAAADAIALTDPLRRGPG